MAHFAEIENGIVKRVLVIEQSVLNTGLWGNPANWVQTSYNTHGGVYVNGTTGTPLRKNFAGKGDTYDKVRDAFISPRPMEYLSWILDENTCKWKAPVPYPTDGKQYYWSEKDLKWKVIKLN